MELKAVTIVCHNNSIRDNNRILFYAIAQHEMKINVEVDYKLILKEVTAYECKDTLV